MNDDTNGEIEQSEEQPEEISPLRQLFIHLARYHDDIRCLDEMTFTVLPILKKNDEKRLKRIKEITEFKETDAQGREVRKVAVDKIIEFRDHLTALHAAEVTYRQNVISILIAKYDFMLSNILKICFQLNPQFLMNPDKKMTYVDLFKIDSLEAKKEEAMYEEIDSLMRGSHCKQIEYLEEKFRLEKRKLGVTKYKKFWHSFLKLTEDRNLYAHNAGIASSLYLGKCNELGIQLPESYHIGRLIVPTDQEINDSFDCMYGFSFLVVQALARIMFQCDKDSCDDEFNKIIYKLLRNEKWKLSVELSDYYIDLPDEYKTNSEARFCIIVNQCIALKQLGEDVTDKIERIKEMPLHGKFKLAIAVLEGDFKKAKALMKKKSVNEQICKEDFLEWPLFLDFRKTKDFKDAFKDLFGHDYVNEIIKDAKDTIQKNKQH